MAAQGEIDVFGKLVSQTTNGVLAGANQIHDPNMNKMQSVINAEVQAALAQAGNTEEIQQIVRDAVGACVLANFESEVGIQIGNYLLGYCNDGDWFLDGDHNTDLDELEVGSIVKVTALPANEEYHVPASVNASLLLVDNETLQITGITGAPVPVIVGHSYKVTGIYQATVGDWVIYTWKDMEKSVTDLVESATAKIVEALGDIDFSALAKQGTNPNATISAILEALQGSGTPSPDIPEGVAERLAMILEHFGIKPISGYEFMTDTEVCDELEDIMRVIDPNLTAAQAAAITEQTLNPSES